MKSILIVLLIVFPSVAHTIDAPIGFSIKPLKSIIWSDTFSPSISWERIVTDPLGAGCNGVLEIPADTTNGVFSKKYSIFDPPLPDEAYYSFWLLFWDGITLMDRGYFSPFDFGRQYVDADGNKTDSLITYSLGFKPNPNGEDYLLIMSGYHTEDNQVLYQGVLVESPIPVKGGVWNHFEIYYKWSTTRNGRITVWQNNEQLWDMQGLYTEFPLDTGIYYRRIALKNASKGTVPARFSFWFENMIISTNRQSAVWNPIYCN